MGTRRRGRLTGAGGSGASARASRPVGDVSGARPPAGCRAVLGNVPTDLGLVGAGVPVTLRVQEGHGLPGRDACFTRVGTGPREGGRTMAVTRRRKSA